jgi:hypothetical protein
MVKQPDKPPGMPMPEQKSYNLEQIAPWVLRASPILAGFTTAFFAAVDRNLGPREGIVLLASQFVLYATGIYLCFPRQHGAQRHN